MAQRPNVLLVCCRPCIRRFTHRRRRFDWVDRNDFVGLVSNLGGCFVAIDGNVLTHDLVSFIFAIPSALILACLRQRRGKLPAARLAPAEQLSESNAHAGSNSGRLTTRDRLLLPTRLQGIAKTCSHHCAKTRKWTNMFVRTTA